MKRLMVGLIVLVLALVVLAGAALLLVDANHFRPQIQASLGKALGREVSIGTLHMSVWTGSLEADEIRIGDDPRFGKQPFVSARSLDLGVELWPLLVHRQLHITSLTLDQPVVRLLQNRKGDWNFAGLGGTPAPAENGAAGAPGGLTVDRLRINDGRIELTRMAGDRKVYDHVQLSADHVGTQAAFPFELKADIAGGGTLALDGRLGPWQSGNAVLTPVDAHLAMHDLDLVGAGLMARDSGVGGVLDLDTQIASAKGVLRSKGRIDARKLQLVASGSPSPQPLRIDYQADYRLDNGTGRIADTVLHAGAAQLSIGGSFDNRPAVMRMDLKVKGARQPIDDLQPLLPVFGVILPKDSRLAGGTASMDLTVRGPLDALVIHGPVSLDGTRLAGYSLGDKLGGALALAGINAPRDTVIQHAEAMLTISPKGIDANPAKAQIAQLGSFTGKGRMAADGALDFRMLVKLDEGVTGAGQAGQGLAGLLGGSKAGGALGGLIKGMSTNGVGVRVGGTASAPSFKLDPKAAVGLLEAGTRSDSTQPASKPPADSGKDMLNNLLQNALKPKQPTSGH
ncbi:AsmA family protein [Frateuria sp. MAH-13]|uniref:AsmA family protein n=1 Tax=Frateuria flava TaxID=2821489 RepID=A0ABS4DN18_9GAMM|nr:AsmA family protein [Frateuria flava]MBP1474442.1 AsmA family protein [Frateuria flava]